jgi:hypothetical protein
MSDVSDTQGEATVEGESAAGVEGGPRGDVVAERRPRSRRRLVTTLTVGAVVLAVLVGGGLVARAQWQKHQRDVAHQRLLQQQQAYLDKVRRLDHEIAVDIAPVQHVLAAMSTPRTGDIIALRDAFANAELAHAVRHDYGDVIALRAPAGWQPHQTDLKEAAVQIRDAVSGMYGDRNSDDIDFLNSDLQTSQGGKLFAGVDDWRQAMLALFVERKEKAPTEVANAGTKRVAPTLTTWAFAVDRACIAGNVRAAPLLRRQHGGDRSTGLMRSEGAVILKIASSIRKAPLPAQHAAAIRRDILSRVPLLQSEGRLINQEADDLDRLDLDAARAALDRLRTTVGGLPVLANTFRKYHLIACAGSVGTNSSHSSVQA